MEKMKGMKGCVVVDDLMNELERCDMLKDLFTKYSSHANITTIHITKNVFYKVSWKHASDNVTIYRITHVLVVFDTPMYAALLGR